MIESRFLEAEKACSELLKSLIPLKDELDATMKSRIEVERLRDNLTGAAAGIANAATAINDIIPALRQFDPAQVMTELKSDAEKLERSLFGQTAEDLRELYLKMASLPKQLEPLRTDQVRADFEQAAVQYEACLLAVTKCIEQLAAVNETNQSTGKELTSSLKRQQSQLEIMTSRLPETIQDGMSSQLDTVLKAVNSSIARSEARHVRHLAFALSAVVLLNLIVALFADRIRTLLVIKSF